MKDVAVAIRLGLFTGLAISIGAGWEIGLPVGLTLGAALLIIGREQSDLMALDVDDLIRETRNWGWAVADATQGHRAQAPRSHASGDSGRATATAGRRLPRLHRVSRTQGTIQGLTARTETIRPVTFGRG
jgi:hypothetical protein